MRQYRVLLILPAALALALGVLSCSRQGSWTASSDEAIAQFEAGLESRMKFYSSEAREHFERALELDPDFVAAKLLLMRYGADKERQEQLLLELKSADLDALTEREKFLIRYTLAREEGDQGKATSILETYLEEAPQDPYGVARLADEAWHRADWDKAEQAYERLLELDPNWVTAQNHLGYMAMAQGNFTEAEERFQAYRFVAPDQANPHDSMGELLTVVGRYEEALVELEKAVAIRPDFCASYMHMLEVLILEGRPYDGYSVLERAESNCPAEWEQGISKARCELALWIDYLDGDFDGPWREERKECLEKVGDDCFLLHRIAALSGRYDVAIGVEQTFAGYLENMGDRASQNKKALRGVLGHLVGVRLLAEGALDEAIDEMRAADGTLFYWGQNQGILKLFNRLNLAYALEAAGRTEESEQVLADVREVNEPFADAYETITEGFVREDG